MNSCKLNYLSQCRKSTRLTRCSTTPSCSTTGCWSPAPRPSFTRQRSAIRAMRRLKPTLTQRSTSCSNRRRRRSTSCSSRATSRWPVQSKVSKCLCQMISTSARVSSSCSRLGMWWLVHDSLTSRGMRSETRWTALTLGLLKYLTLYSCNSRV